MIRVVYDCNVILSGIGCLLTLKKPFGIEIIRPPELLRRIKAAG